MKNSSLLSFTFIVLIGLEGACSQDQVQQMIEQAFQLKQAYSNPKLSQIQKDQLNREAYQLLLNFKPALNQKESSQENIKLFNQIRQLYVDSMNSAPKREPQKIRTPASFKRQNGYNDISLNEGLRILNSSQAQQLIYSDSPLLQIEKLTKFFDLVGL